MPHDFVIPSSSLAPPERALALALRASHAMTSNKSLVKQIFFSWSNLHGVVLRLAGVIGSSFPSENGDVDLLTCCLSDAARAYQDAQEDTKNNFLPAAIFLHTLMTRASLGLARYDVFGINNTGSLRWDMSKENLFEFGASWESLKFVGQAADEDLANGTHIILASRLLTVDDATLLSKMLRSLSLAEATTLDERNKAPVIPLRMGAMIANS